MPQKEGGNEGEVGRKKLGKIEGEMRKKQGRIRPPCHPPLINEHHENK